jgi:hypothetical protein
MSDINDPDWTEILRAVQDQLAERIHTSCPGIVKSYDSTTQVASVQLAVQLKGENGEMTTVPVLDDVPVCWPGGASGGLHVPLAAGDTVMVLFSESDFSGWWDTGSVSAPKMLARHDLNAVAIPGLRREGSPMAVTGGHVTLAHSSAVHLGSDSASDPVALKTPTQAGMTDLLDLIISAAGSITAPGGGPAFVAALNAAKVAYVAGLSVGATKVKAT